MVANQKNEGQNVLQLAIRSRFKFIYRPAGLGNRDAAAEKLTLTASGSSLAINNPTPFYITVSRISRDGGKALNSKTRCWRRSPARRWRSPPPSTAAKPDR